MLTEKAKIKSWNRRWGHLYPSKRLEKSYQKFLWPQGKNKDAQFNKELYQKAIKFSELKCVKNWKSLNLFVVLYCTVQM